MLGQRLARLRATGLRGGAWVVGGALATGGDVVTTGDFFFEDAVVGGAFVVGAGAGASAAASVAAASGAATSSWCALAAAIVLVRTTVAPTLKPAAQRRASCAAWPRRPGVRCSVIGVVALVVAALVLVGVPVVGVLAAIVGVPVVGVLAVAVDRRRGVRSQRRRVHGRVGHGGGRVGHLGRGQDADVGTGSVCRQDPEVGGDRSEAGDHHRYDESDLCFCAPGLHGVRVRTVT